PRPQGKPSFLRIHPWRKTLVFRAAPEASHRCQKRPKSSCSPAARGRMDRDLSPRDPQAAYDQLYKIGPHEGTPVEPCDRRIANQAYGYLSLRFKTTAPAIPVV